MAFTKRFGPMQDMPGHNFAYFVDKPELMCDCPKTLSPINTQFWRASFDPTNPAVYDFLETFIGEMATAFPDHFLHLGNNFYLLVPTSALTLTALHVLATVIFKTDDLLHSDIWIVSRWR